jgi:hypothetical protein
MAKTSSARGMVFLRWLKHRALVGAEAVLLVGILQQLLSQRLTAVTMPNALRVVITMAMTLGVIGGVFVIARAVAARGVHHTHLVAKALPVPLATWIAHGAAFFGLFLLYAIVWHLPVEVPWLGTVGTPKP